MSLEADFYVVAVNLNEAECERHAVAVSYGGDVGYEVSPDWKFHVELELKSGARYRHYNGFASEDAAQTFADWVTQGVDLQDNEYWAEERPAYGSKRWLATGGDEWSYDEQEAAHHGVACKLV